MNELLHHNLRASAKRSPSHIAYRFLDAELCYAELDHKTDQLAATLQDCGVKKGDRVGIYMERCLETAIAVYGILKAGAAYVPIDPQSPQSRIHDILESCGVTCLVSQERMDINSLENQRSLGFIVGCDSSQEICHPGLQIISWPEVFNRDIVNYREPLVTPSDLAYIMFTSGSTGVPKGIMHTHASGCAHARIAVDMYGISAEDVIGNHAPLHFDICTMGYLSSLLAGATTVIIPEPHTRMPASMSMLAQNERFSIWYSVPFALIQMLTRGALEHRDLSALRWVLFGGEPFSPRQIRDLMDFWPNAQFANLYGPAETNQCTLYLAPSTLSGDEASIPIGKPCPEVDALIVDSANNPVLEGEAGELLIHAPTMMQGYWAREDLNANCFYNHPQDNKRYYRTGDLASVDHTGLMHYHGRQDRLIKLRGNRIELDEIEAAVLGHDEIEEAAAYVLDPGTEKERVELAVLTASSSTRDIEHFRQRIVERLPRFAIPDQIIAFSAFPRTGSGKVDRKAVQAAREAQASSAVLMDHG